LTEIAINPNQAMDHPAATARPKLLEMKPRQPKTGGREAAGSQGATLVVAAFGAMFLAYAFDFNGFQTGLNAYFEGLNTAVKAHNSQAARLIIIALPFVGGLMAATFLWAFVNTVTLMTAGFAPKKNRVEQPPVSIEAASAEPALEGSGKKPVQKAVCVKPLRLDQRDRGVTKVILTRR
jgi:hypothetical protein